MEWKWDGMKNVAMDTALAKLALMLEGSQARWIVGGSTGLALRGAILERAPSDLDIYVDGNAVVPVDEKLRDYRLDGPTENRTERYLSILSHYCIEDTMVELVGDFRVTAFQSAYKTEVDDFLFPGSDSIEVANHAVAIIPLGHELIFNLLRERPDRAAEAGRLISEDPKRHLPLLQQLIRRNEISFTVAAEALKLAGNG
jgi:hypothetical protein